MGSVRGTQALTDRERDIIRLLLEGSTNREMGETLGVSWLTVRNHISRLLVKFEASKRLAPRIPVTNLCGVDGTPRNVGRPTDSGCYHPNQ